MMLLPRIAPDPGAFFGNAQDDAAKGLTVRRSYRGKCAEIGDNELTDLNGPGFGSAPASVRRKGVQRQAQEPARCGFFDSLLGVALNA